jgi:hypothetical protein
MNNVTQIVRKVRQAPWRVQRQWIGLFLLGLVLMAMVAGIYLNVTVRATNQRVNADLEIQLAGLISIESMQKRADAMGFQPADPTDITFVAVPGYKGQSPVDLSMPSGNQPEVPIILPEYTESWVDYFINQQASSASNGAKP